MFTVTLQRNKCIGCNYCSELEPSFFCMSIKDGKCILIDSIKKKNFFIKKILNNNLYNRYKNTSKICPVKIINIYKSKKKL
ncbi:ferredoxin [Candidatus Shikimatogenerans silvanidophilus]|uniref:ferredoxin n=1 Tax=Candidatus Shikimatogenerans silvanidophilus TaxID=2782547 RepID=UPI001BA89EAB|nr:ferredoxin [Candidatus Shikimatogenerans silvanidophilus]